MVTHLMYGPVNAVARALVHQILEQPWFSQIRFRHQVFQHGRSDFGEPALFAELPSGLAVRVVGVHFSQIKSTSYKRNWKKPPYYVGRTIHENRQTV